LKYGTIKWRTEKWESSKSRTIRQKLKMILYFLVLRC